MNPLLQRNPGNLMEGFNHPEFPPIYAHLDTITTLEDCPFPLETDTFKVIRFGTSRQEGKHTPGSARFALVEYVKGCGHLSRDRIGFFEGVQDFDHYGTLFTGKSYSITDWGNRIEFFRSGLCDVCGLYEHIRWAHYHAHERTSPKKRTLASFDLLMDANYLNWREFVSREDFEKAITGKEDLSLSLRQKHAPENKESALPVA